MSEGTEIVGGGLTPCVLGSFSMPLASLISLTLPPEAPADTLTGRIDGVLNVRRTLEALVLKKIEDEKLQAELAAAEADRLEAEREAAAKEHYEEVGFGSWG
jgi:hypothetical protein